MKPTRASAVVLLFSVLQISPHIRPDCEPFFRRADANADAKVDLSDGIATLGYLFLGSPAPPCLDAADANDSGDLDLTDAVFTFLFLFAAGGPPPPPGTGECGPDPTGDGLECSSGAPCPVGGAEKEICDGIDNDCDGVIDCPPGFFCQTPVGECGGAAACAEIPLACDKVFKPVCGCDGKTYGNSCEAASASMSIDHEGECTTGLPCTTNEECEGDAYCERDPGDCINEGTCAPRPGACPENFDPVCGCDGRTYGNACNAAANRMNISSDGECPVTECTGNDECLGYCAKKPGDCEGSGTCEPRPEACPAVFRPVCGCDGNTYGNSCEAASAGVNVLFEGTCDMPKCESSDDCELGRYCDKSGGACIGSGVCTPIPEVCPDDIDPVCGCDGVTYGNACEAAAAGQGVQHAGECIVE